MSTCEHDRQDDVCWECKDERIAALERVVEALKKIRQWTSEWKDTATQLGSVYRFADDALAAVKGGDAK